MARSVVAQQIEATRLAKRLSRQQLAEKMGVTRLQIWRIETGVTEVSADAAARFADALGVSISHLYRGARAS